MPLTVPLKTRAAARELNVSLSKLRAAIGSGKLDPPAKDESGDFQWAEEDLERARQVLATDLRRRPAEPAAAES